jgi:hypothetical protein
MRTPSSLIALAASIVALASGDARGDTTWTFTTLAGRSTHVALPPAAAGVDAMVFNVTAAAVAPTQVTRMVFMVMGTVQSSEIGNFQLVYYPSGVAANGIVLATSSGATFAPGSPTNLVSFDLTAPIAVQGNWSALFGLRTDVKVARSFLFAPRLQTVTVQSGGAERFLVETEDLPLSGDTFYVN